MRLSSPVELVARVAGGGVDVTVAGAAAERFDEAVLACHSDQALAMLADPTQAEREVLGAIAYLPSEVVLHGDASLLPRRAAAQASWNAHLTSPPKPVPTVTYDLRRLQGLPTRRPILATLNRTEDIDPSTIDARFAFSHPVFSTAGVAAQRRHGEISGADRIHYAGAYWRWGFHEDGVWSAHRVAERFGAPGGGGSMTAAVYAGTVRHRRLRQAAPADFTHPISMLYVELDELPRALGGHLVRRWPGLVRIRPRDLHGRTHDLASLRAALRRTVAEQTGRPAPEGRIGLLTQPRVAACASTP